MREIRVWDAPTRLFHWCLVVLLSLSWWTGENAYYEWHEKSGLALLCLIVFRIIWGIWGSQTARFGDFVKGPPAVLGHIRAFFSGGLHHHPGHNPLAGYAVIGLLAILLAQAVLGLFAQADYGVFTSPWADVVAQEQSETLTSWHKQLFDWVLIAIGVHIFAIFAYGAFHRIQLIGPMISGRAALDAPQPDMASSRRALLSLLLAILVGWGGVDLVEPLIIKKKSYIAEKYPGFPG